jgi:hypothetical protein
MMLVRNLVYTLIIHNFPTVQPKWDVSVDEGVVVVNQGTSCIMAGCGCQARNRELDEGLSKKSLRILLNVQNLFDGYVT